MVFLFWDASALSKNYTEEIGHETADALFNTIPVDGHASTLWGLVETHSILRRRFNGGLLDNKAFRDSVSLLQAEFSTNATFTILDIDEAVMYTSIVLIDRRNLNSTDAVLLTALLNYARSPDAPTCVMVAADKRLLRAADAEGLPALDPETTSVADATAFIAAL